LTDINKQQKNSSGDVIPERDVFLFTTTNGYMCVQFTFLAPLTSEIETVSPNWGPKLLLRVTLEGPKWYHWILQV